MTLHVLTSCSHIYFSCNELVISKSNYYFFRVYYKFEIKIIMETQISIKQSSLILQNLIKIGYSRSVKKTLAQLFSCEFCEISKNTLSYRTPPAAASAISCTQPSTFLSLLQEKFMHSREMICFFCFVP